MTLLKSLNHTHRKPAYLMLKIWARWTTWFRNILFKIDIEAIRWPYSNHQSYSGLYFTRHRFQYSGWKTALQKHFLLGLGLHCLVGYRKVNDILYKFGHYVSYNYVWSWNCLRWNCTGECKGGFNLTTPAKIPK